MAIDFSSVETQTDLVTSTWTKFASSGQNYLLTQKEVGNILIAVSTSAPTDDDISHTMNQSQQVSSAILPANDNMWYKTTTDTDIKIALNLWA